MKKSGFTLIEVMVVLSILAIIAILAYNFFGSTMKEARVSTTTTRYYNDMRTIIDAWEKYFIDNPGAPPAEYSSLNSLSVGYLDPLVDAGIIKSKINPPTDDPATYRGYAVVAGLYDIAGTAATDEVLIAEVEEDVCVEFNKKYSTIDPPLPTAIHYSAVPRELPAQCYRYTADLKYRLIMLVRADEG